jgi:hypothetical protein
MNGFGTRDYAAVIWYSVCRWLEVVVVLPAEVVMSYGVLVGSGSNKKIRRGYSVVWLAFIWVLWKVRNNRVFNNGAESVDDAVDQIQRLSWQCHLSNRTTRSCLLYEWVWNPGDCMIRSGIDFGSCCGLFFLLLPVLWRRGCVGICLIFFLYLYPMLLCWL